MSGSNDRDDAVARGRPYLRGDVPVALIDQHFLDAGQVLRQFAHHLIQFRTNLEPLYLGGIGLLVGERGTDQLGQQLRLVPEVGACPCPPERRLHIAIAELERNAGRLGGMDGRDHLLAWLDARVRSHPSLKGRQREVGQQEEGLAVLDDPDDVGVGPRIGCVHRTPARLVQFDADGVG